MTQQSVPLIGAIEQKSRILARELCNSTETTPGDQRRLLARYLKKGLIGIMQEEMNQLQSIKFPKRVLSLILCSRNDQYMGNSLWRLQTCLNYVAKNVHELGREDDIQVLVADWGSKLPLKDVLELTPAAAKIASFLLIPPEIAIELQKDSPFPEVLALNAAVRRANGEYIGRIDQDTLVGKIFLNMFFELFEGSRHINPPIESTLVFCNRRNVPYRFAARCPSFWKVDWFIHKFGRSLPIDYPDDDEQPFFMAPVGIWLLHRNIWEECGGYDERFIYMGYMEIDMINRLTQKYKLVHLEDEIDCDFYHLEHYHPFIPRIMSRKINRFKTDPFHPNDDYWGLVQYPLEVLACSPKSGVLKTARRIQLMLECPFFIILLLYTGTLMICDNLILSLMRQLRFLFSFYTVWKRRARIAWETVCGEPFFSWPRLLRELWTQKKYESRKITHKQHRSRLKGRESK